MTGSFPHGLRRIWRHASSPFSFAMPMSRKTTSGRNSDSAATAAMPSWVTRTSLPINSSRSPMLVARSTLSSATRIRRLLREGAPAASSATWTSGCRAGRHVDEQRQPDDELAAGCAAFAVHFDRPAVLVDQPLDEREADAQSALWPIGGRAELAERLENVTPAPPSECPFRNRERERRSRSPSRAAASEICPPSSVYFAALLSRLARICASRAKSPLTRTGCGGGAHRERVAARIDRTGRVVSTATAMTLATSTASNLRSIFPCVIRDTSRRSSTRRHSCLT